jgi:hypothetical protein
MDEVSWDEVSVAVFGILTGTILLLAFILALS